jgi:uncharacterized protein (DUF305 family)
MKTHLLIMIAAASLTACSTQTKTTTTPTDVGHSRTTTVQQQTTSIPSTPTTVTVTSPDSTTVTTTTTRVDAEPVSAIQQPDSRDAEFLDRMLDHQQTALDLASNASTRTETADVKRAADQIVTENQAEITRIQTLRSQWFPTLPEDNTPTASASDNYSDEQFLDVMIAHSETGLSMLQDIQANAQHAELKDLAREMSSNEKLLLADLRTLAETAEH